MVQFLSSAASGDIHYNLAESFYIEPIFILGVMILFAIVGGKLIEKLNFPKVTGYIIMGILIGPSLFEILTGGQIFFLSGEGHVRFDGIISSNMVHAFQIIRQVAIGFIGYTIGLELKLSKLKKTGKQVTVVTLSQAFSTAVLVGVAVLLYLTLTGGEHAVTYALILAAIATATAPAPIVAVVKNYRTKGPVTDMLLPLVALDDAIGIMLFATMLSLGTTLLGATGETLTAFQIIYEPIKEIVLSLGFGALIGLLLQYVVKKFNRDSDAMLLMMIISAVFLGIGLGKVVHASAILLPMTIGVVLTNTIEESFEHRLTKATDLFSAPIMLAFFIIAGLELDLTKIPIVGILGIIYVIVRVVGKVSGAYVSAKAMKAPPTVTKYLGWTLIPQAGVAIDMAITANQRFASIEGFEDIGSNIMAIVLAATVFYEIVGLVIVKNALHKAGEIDASNDVGWQASH